MQLNDFDKISLSQTEIHSLIDIGQPRLSRYLALINSDNNHSNEKRRRYNIETTRRVIKELYSHKLVPDKKVQVFFNFKGGTGKTSLCYQAAIMFALYGFKVLAIDCDPQAHLSFSLGFNESYNDYKTLYDVIINKLPIKDTIINVMSGLDAIPSNLSLTRLEAPLNQMHNREKLLLKAIETIKSEYDFIFIDTNPTISTLNGNAMIAADILNIICETQPYSLKGLEILIDVVKDFSQVMETTINYRIIPNKYEAKTVSSQESLGMLQTKYKQNLMGVLVRKCEDINVSAKSRLPLIAFCNKRSIALEDIIDLTKELIFKSTHKKEAKRKELSNAA